ncbi:hypothetical protein ARMGADRAFT_1014310 [Armillaria gallica]|uniref:Uncharacterized protein n=1 Tax=Armillaria gallica TaxID=47427 RepID=A0A2H3DS58_ARMGA|nr:hypothetical protein ARMGADRAFT_1014310 [Armillaria gallica]
MITALCKRTVRFVSPVRLLSLVAWNSVLHVMIATASSSAPPPRVVCPSIQRFHLYRRG